jgi:hypothetical protein
MSSFSPRDLNISLRAVNTPRLVLNGGPKGAIFPGWFLEVAQNEGYDTVIDPVQLTFAEVRVITDVIDRTVDKTDRSHWRVSNAAQRCDTAMRDDLHRQLEAAEKAAERVPELRRRLGLNVADS